MRPSNAAVIVVLALLGACQTPEVARVEPGPAPNPALPSLPGLEDAHPGDGWEDAAARIGLDPEAFSVAGVPVEQGELYLVVSTYEMNADDTKPVTVRLVLVQDGEQAEVASGFGAIFGEGQDLDDELGYCEEAFATVGWRKISGRYFLSLSLACRFGADHITTNEVAAFYDGTGALPALPRRVWSGRVESLQSSFGECIVRATSAFSLHGLSLKRVLTTTATWDALDDVEPETSEEDCEVVETDQVTEETFSIPAR